MPAILIKVIFLSIQLSQGPQAISFELLAYHGSAKGEVLVLERNLSDDLGYHTHCLLRLSYPANRELMRRCHPSPSLARSMKEAGDQELFIASRDQAIEQDKAGLVKRFSKSPLTLDDIRDATVFFSWGRAAMSLSLDRKKVGVYDLILKREASSSQRKLATLSFPLPESPCVQNPSLKWGINWAALLSGEVLVASAGYTSREGGCYVRKSRILFLPLGRAASFFGLKLPVQTSRENQDKHE